MKRLKAHAFQILAALSQGQCHGSGVARRVLDQTDGDVQLWPVTLYRTLDELSENGLIREVEDPDLLPAGSSRRLRYYRLTEAGAAALSDEAARQADQAQSTLHNLRRGAWRP